jgi:hypothetical protein
MMIMIDHSITIREVGFARRYLFKSVCPFILISYLLRRATARRLTNHYKDLDIIWFVMLTIKIRDLSLHGSYIENNFNKLHSKNFFISKNITKLSKFQIRRWYPKILFSKILWLTSMLHLQKIDMIFKYQTVLKTVSCCDLCFPLAVW